MKLPTIIRSESMLISWHDKSIDQFCNFSLTAKRLDTTSCSFLSWRNWWNYKKTFSRLLFHVKTVLDSRSLYSNQQNNCVSRYIILCSWHNVTTATEKCRVMTKCFHIMISFYHWKEICTDWWGSRWASMTFKDYLIYLHYTIETVHNHLVPSKNLREVPKRMQCSILD